MPMSLTKADIVERVYKEAGFSKKKPLILLILFLNNQRYFGQRRESKNFWLWKFFHP